MTTLSSLEKARDNYKLGLEAVNKEKQGCQARLAELEREHYLTAGALVALEKLIKDHSAPAEEPKTDGKS